MGSRWRNWGRTQTCRPVRIARPASEEEIRAVVSEAASSARTVKAVGAGHSFTDIACTDGILVSLDRYAGVLRVDPDAKTVTVQAGISLGKLNAVLATLGLAMPNLGDIAYQSVAGAISTATHGTGLGVGNLGTFVSGLSLVCADGSVLECSEDSDPQLFKAAQVSLGALGIISTVTLRVTDAFRLHALERGEKLDDVLDTLEDEVKSNEHFEFFWFPHTANAYVKRNNRTDRPPTELSRWRSFRNDILMENVAFGAACLVGKARPDWIPRIMRDVVGAQLGRRNVVRPSHEVFASTRLVRFSEMEYAIPREHAAEAIRRVRGVISERGFNVNFPVEVRFVAPDDIPMSPAYERETCYIAVHLYRGMDYRPYFGAVEEIMRSYDGRPHWGKLHLRTSANLRGAYPRFDDFIEVRDRLDPRGVFHNAYLDRVLGPPPVAQ